MNVRPCILWCGILSATLLLAGSARAQTFRLPGEDIGPVIVSPGADPIVYPDSNDFVHVDEYVDPENVGVSGDDWGWTMLPNSLIYRSYLASPKESRMYGGVDAARDDNLLWNATTGARVGILRYGDHKYVLPNGWQWDVEGSAQVRLDVPEDVDVRSVDFRGGSQITYGHDAHRVKFGYYHLSSHLGDEFVIKNPGYDRMNFARDVLILGYSYYATPNFRLYGEVGWAFYSIISEPWEFQAGFDWAPQQRTGVYGAPFLAMNGHVRQELDFSGNFTAQVGWAWRGDDNAHLLRLGFQYFNGMSSQYSFAFNHEETFGMGVWYDF